MAEGAVQGLGLWLQVILGVGSGLFSEFGRGGFGLSEASPGASFLTQV